MSELELLTREVRSLRLLLLGTRINKTAMAERLGITLGTLHSHQARRCASAWARWQVAAG